MRKVIVGNLITLDGYYEGKGKSLSPLFENFHPDYAGDETLDNYFLERLRASDTLVLSGGASFLAFKEYWWNRESVPGGHPREEGNRARDEPYAEGRSLRQAHRS